MIREKSDTRGKKMLEVKEYYTSQTCSQCGKLKKDLGSSEIYNCNSCGMVCDRDLNSALGILLR